MNQTVFGSEMVLLTFIIGAIQFLSLFIHFGVLISRPYNRANWRFLLLIFLFVYYNVCSGLFPDRNIYWINPLMQNILAFSSGIILASYYFYFLVKEIEISQRRFFNIKFLVVSLFLSFILLYLTVYLFSKDFDLAKQIFIIPPVVIGCYFCVNTIQEIRLKSTQNNIRGLYRSLNIAGKLGIVFMSTMPIVVSIGDYQLINNGLVNVSFFLIWISYYILLVVQAKNEKELNSFNNKRSGKLYVTEIGLTPRELEIAAYILKGDNYNDLVKGCFFATYQK